jgi:5-methylcytosine-specific restriction protein B
MNTADRSLAMIDYALRRRFSFIPIEPAFDNEGFITDFRAVYPNADTVIEKMKRLNAFIAETLDKHHRIGHSYFCSKKPLNDNDIKAIFKYEIVELLREYFFDDDSTLKKAMEIIE